MIIPTTKEAYDLFHQGSLAFARAERIGLRIDIDYCHKQKEKLIQKINYLKNKIEISKFGRKWQSYYGKKYNFNSNQQLAHFLYKVNKIKPVSTNKGLTSEEALTKLNIPELNGIVQIRKFIKLRDILDSYIKGQINGVIHPTFNLHLVRTYRPSSSKPNFQNIPKQDEFAKQIIRSAIFPRKNHQFVSMDFSGIEIRMACVYTQDPQLIHDTIKGDMHHDMAIELYQLKSLDKYHDGEKNLRQGAKNGFIFPEFYGDYYKNCAISLLKWANKAYLKDGTPALVHLQNKNLITLSKSGQIKNISNFISHVYKIENYFWNTRYKQYTKWKNKIWEEYQKKGYIDMLTGFRCKGLMNKKAVTNYPLQGTAFHCLLKVFIDLDYLMYSKNYDSFPVFQVYDEITTDVNPNEYNKIVNIMYNLATKQLRNQWKWINIPLEVEMERNNINQSLNDMEVIKL